MHESLAVTHAAPADIAEIHALLSDFAWFADHGDGDALSRLFLPEGALHVGGQEHVGREQIARDCMRRAAVTGRTVRHLWSNLRVEHVETGRISTTAMQLTFEQVAQDGAGATQLRVNDLFDAFTRDASGRWRFAQRRIERAIGLTL